MDLDFDACYRAVSARDSRFDGRFVTAVRSTGVYCRPICPARTPLRRNVAFFAHPAAAESAGYRACRRCRPEVMPGSRLWDARGDLVGRALRLIADGAVEAGGVAALAQRLHVSERQLHRLFVAELGAGPLAIARNRRGQLALRLLRDTSLPITDIAYASGFASLRQFNATMRQLHGRTPTELRAGQPATAGRALRLPAREPYDAASVLGWLAARTIAGVDEVVGDTYRRTTASGGVVTARVLPDGALVSVTTGAPGELAGTVARMRRLLDLDADPLAIAAVLGADPVLAPLVAARPGLRVTGAWDGFEVAVRAVVGQQVSVEAGRTLVGRLVARVGQPLPSPDGPLRYVFPTPEAVASASLDGLGLTGRRAATLRCLAAAVADGSVRLDGSGEPGAVRAALLALPGIGPWTADYIALHAGPDPDAFPVGDLVLRRSAAALGLPTDERTLLARAEAWRPWRGYAAQHLWAFATDHVKERAS